VKNNHEKTAAWRVEQRWKRLVKILTHPEVSLWGGRCFTILKKQSTHTNMEEREMKRTSIALVAALTLAFTVPAFADNGAPSGAHYNLNIIGHTNCPGDDLVGSNRHVIAVLLNFDDGSQHGTLPGSLDKRNKIFLQEGEFNVIDGNACNGDGATFQLPANPYTCPLNDPQCLNTDPTFQNYLVYARALGQPGGSATITTCATDPVSGEIVCSTENVVLVRNKGKSSFDNVTKELTTLCLDTDDNTICDTRVGIFDASLEDYFWDYDNDGLRLAQIRFYPIPD
jgi:hypothetical protein